MSDASKITKPGDYVLKHVSTKEYDNSWYVSFFCDETKQYHTERIFKTKLRDGETEESDRVVKYNNGCKDKIRLWETNKIIAHIGEHEFNGNKYLNIDQFQAGETEWLNTPGNYVLRPIRTKETEDYYDLLFEVMGKINTLYNERMYKTRPRDGEKPDSDRVVGYNVKLERKVREIEKPHRTIDVVIVGREYNGKTYLQISSWKAHDGQVVQKPEPEPERQTTQEYLDSIKAPGTDDEVPF